MPVELTVVGSINLDLVARVEQLPRAGETVAGRDFERIPGGKGANQAVAAARLGAAVRMIGAVGTDTLAGESLTGLEGAGVELQLERTGVTGIALILVAADGENQIVVVPGANAEVTPQSPGGAVLTQLEVPDAVVHAAARNAEFFALNAAPARPIDLEPDLLIVNRLEHEVVVARQARRRHVRRRGSRPLRGGPRGRARHASARPRGRRDRRRRRIRRVPGRLVARGTRARRSPPPCLRGRRARGVAARRPTIPAHRRAG